MTAQILKGPNLTPAPNLTLGQFFFNSAKKFADRICQIDASTHQTYTFSQAKEMSTNFALKMREKGITSEDVIVSCSSVTLDTPIPILASFYLGAKVVNLDPTLSLRQVVHLLSTVSPRMIFVEEASLELIENSLKSVKFEPEIVVFGKSNKYLTFADLVEPIGISVNFEPVSVGLDETAIMFFSSGSTGLPKAICHSHRSFLDAVYSFVQSNSKLDTILSFTSFYWITGVLLLTTTFAIGGRRILCGSTVDPEKTLKAIENYKVTYVFLAPILTYKFTNYTECHKYNTSSVYTIMTGGTPMSLDQFSKFGTVFKHSNLIFGYGLTECGIVTFFDPRHDQKLIQEKRGSSGTLNAGFSMKIIDIETNQVLGTNQKGEICIKSPSLMKGYYNRDSSTVFDEEGFLKTGDIGYYDEDHCLYFVERLKEMFKYLSWHIVPTAIEAVLLEHPAIQEAIVFGLPKSEEEGEVPTAGVVLKSDCTATKQEIEEFVAERVSDRERLRGGVFFLEELKKTPSGKVTRKEIRDTTVNSLI